jgi:SpoU rRNA methylase family enzyme
MERGTAASSGKGEVSPLMWRRMPRCALKADSEVAKREDLKAKIEVLFPYLVYLNNGASVKRVVKTIDLSDQKTAP